MKEAEETFSRDDVNNLMDIARKPLEERIQELEGQRYEMMLVIRKLQSQIIELESKLTPPKRPPKIETHGGYSAW